MKPRSRTLTALALALAFSLAGSAAADTAYLREIVDRSTVTMEDAVRMTVLYTADPGAPADFAAQRDWLISRGILTGGLARKEQQSVLLKKELAVIAVKALAIRGGLSLRLASAMGQENAWTDAFYRRFALREASYLGLISSGGGEDTIGGQELISVFTRMAEYRSKQKAS